MALENTFSLFNKRKNTTTKATIPDQMLYNKIAI